MKNLLFFVILLLGVVELRAQENIVKASLVFGNLGVQYERSLSQHFSLAAQAGFGFSFVSTNRVINDFTTGQGYSLEGRYYFSSDKKKLTGWHIGPSINIISTESGGTNREYQTNLYSVSAGKQWLFDSNLSIEFVLAISYQYLVTNDPYEYPEDKVLPVSPTGGFSVGYFF